MLCESVCACELVVVFLIACILQCFAGLDLPGGLAFTHIEDQVIAVLCLDDLCIAVFSGEIKAPCIELFDHCALSKIVIHTASCDRAAVGAALDSEACKAFFGLFAGLPLSIDLFDLCLGSSDSFLGLSLFFFGSILSSFCSRDQNMTNCSCVLFGEVSVDEVENCNGIAVVDGCCVAGLAAILGTPCCCVGCLGTGKIAVCDQCSIGIVESLLVVFIGI